MGYNLFLDDDRMPEDCCKFMGKHSVIYYSKEWTIAKSYTQFVEIIEKNGLPEFISFDHDLADEHYKDLFSNENWKTDNKDIKLNYDLYKEKTGYEAAKWLIDYCEDNNLSLPNFIAHTRNPVGKVNIETLLENYKKSKMNNQGG